jgi:hypothetical protein
MPKKKDVNYVFVHQEGELKDILKECYIKTYLHFICEYLHDELNIEYKMFIPYIPIPEKIWVSDTPKISTIEVGSRSIDITRYNVKYKEKNIRKLKYKPLNEIKKLNNDDIFLKLRIMNIICELLGVKHTDLHEGNIYYKPGISRIGIIDWGRVIFNYKNSNQNDFFKSEYYIGNRLEELMNNKKYKSDFVIEFEQQIKKHLNDIIPKGKKNNDQYMYSVGNQLLLDNDILNRFSDIGLTTKKTTNECVCMDDCTYDSVYDRITNIYTKSKKCKVNKKFCKNKKTKKELPSDYCK